MDNPICVVEANGRKPEESLHSVLRFGSSVRIATAFVKRSGLGLFREDLERLLDAGGKLEVIFGLDFRITDPQAVEDLMTLARKYESAQYFAFSDDLHDDAPTFHPKLYIGEARDGATLAMLGSSNLTRGGMDLNLEANVLLQGTTSVQPMRGLIDLYERFRRQETVFVPDEEYLARYAQVYQRVRRHGREALRDAATRSTIDELKSREELLPGTVPTQRGLVVQAIRDLGGGTAWVHWSDIAEWVEDRARSLGLNYKWDTLRNSVRGRLNEDTVGKAQAGLFERQGGVSGRHGRYRLSKDGLEYRGRPTAGAG
jgi:HKD family nuclease